MVMQPHSLKNPVILSSVYFHLCEGQSYWKDERISEEIPACRQMFNIFHPFDPVAYRIEPLICKEYMGKRPVLIPYHRGGKRLHIGFQEFAEDLAASSQVIFSNLDSMKVKMVGLFSSKNKNDREEVPNESHVKEKSYGSLMMERLSGSENGRIDHMLQDKTFQHSYISALGSHTNYWRDPDTALFILKHLYRDIPEESNTSEEQTNEGSSDSTSVNRRKQVELFFQRAILEEDIPLTFSDKIVVREFTRKMRKSMN
ncbi:hypothetical protein ZOSMA_25G00110 [Zostera marina]|uniref:DDHD domain-containing protein n=1 Tax=Zostera marina TaxID=29655 RepID=A0A0K9PFC1_ZOSMR|nr:hypothetical protein ZOSMA_25G00110 [Zostera marina]